MVLLLSLFQIIYTVSGQNPDLGTCSFKRYSLSWCLWSIWFIHLSDNRILTCTGLCYTGCEFKLHFMWKREKLTLLKYCYRVVWKSFSCARALSLCTSVPSTHAGTPEFHPGPMWQRTLMSSAQCTCVLENTVPSCVFLHNCSIVNTWGFANFLRQKKWKNGIPLLNVASDFSLTKYR